MKIFVTGDNHFGRKYTQYVAIKQRLIESRFIQLENMVKIAEEEKCEFFVVTGDLFDNTKTIAKRDIERVVGILGEFSQNVLVLPGNHDFYTGNEEVWRTFESKARGYSNIALLNKYEPFVFECEDGKVTIYPAYCDSKHSETNRLDWIKGTTINSGGFHIGIVHGALEGMTMDKEGNYFPMKRSELQSIPMDVWLLGHAHIANPEIPKDIEVSGYNIFNPGTHEQLDMHNRTEGNAFIISLEQGKEVKAKRIVTGVMRYYDDEIVFSHNDSNMEEVIRSVVQEYDNNSIVRLTLKGTVSEEMYQQREKIYENTLQRFLQYIIQDNELSEEITVEKIRDEFSEIGFTAKFLENLAEDPLELQMAYELVKKQMGV